MDDSLKKALLQYETDLTGALYRFSNNEELYYSCLGSFLNDPTMAELDTAIKNKAWDNAFTAAHALKGIAGNMGFVPLFHAAAETVVLIRTGRTSEIGPSYATLKKHYSEIAAVLNKYCAAGQGG